MFSIFHIFSPLHWEVQHWLALDDLELVSEAPMARLMAEHFVKTDPQSLGIADFSRVQGTIFMGFNGLRGYDYD